MAAAAAALARSRGVTVSSSTKGLVFMFTLLSLVCLSSSRIDKGRLESLKEFYKEAQQELDKVKAEYTSKMQNLSEIPDEYLTILDPLAALKKKIGALCGDTTPEDTDVEGIKVFFKEIRARIDWGNKEIVEEIARTETQIRTIKRVIELLEKQQAEL